MGRSHIWGVGTAFEAKRWLSLDVCGMLGITVSWAVHLYALAVLFVLLISNSPISLFLFTFGYLPSSVLAMISLYMASTTDPGAVPMGARPLVTVRRSTSTISSSSSSGSNGLTNNNNSNNRAIRRCHKCDDNFKPARAHHDSVTGRCIVKFDHFCPWINNAVGALNHKFFCLFLLYTAMCCLMSLVLILIRFLQCQQVTHSDNNSSSSSSSSVTDPGRLLATTHYVYEECNYFYDNQWIWGLAISSVIFLLFTSIMSCEQLDAIETGKGKVQYILYCNDCNARVMERIAQFVMYACVLTSSLRFNYYYHCQIARMKMSIGQGGTEYSSVTEEFNEMFGGSTPHPTWHWFLPLSLVFPRGMKKVVLGFDWDETFDAIPYCESNVEDHTSDSHPTGRDDQEAGLQMTAALSSPSLPLPLSGNSIHSLQLDGLNNRRRQDSGSSVSVPDIV